MITALFNVFFAGKLRKIEPIPCAITGALFGVFATGTHLSLITLSNTYIPKEYLEAVGEKWKRKIVFIMSFGVTIILTSVAALFFSSLLGRNILLRNAFQLSCIDFVFFLKVIDNIE